MNKYIPAEKLIAEIETWIDIAEKRINNNAPIEHPETIDEEKLKYLQKTRESKITWLDGQEEALKKVLSIITSLQQEQPEVDLEKEINNYHITKKPHVWFHTLDEIARHFYELGLNARKEE